MSDPIKQITLEEGGHRVSLLSYGARLQSWHVDHDGTAVNVVLGYEDPRAYLIDPHSMGILAGRVANRISGAAFVLNGQVHHLDTNEPPQTLHGGRLGFGQRYWDLEQNGPHEALLRLVSEDGDMGFPGRVTVEIRVTLNAGRLAYDMTATVDCPTPVNIAHHAYWNLMGDGDVLGHRVQIAATQWTPAGPGLIPTGEITEITPAMAALRDGKALGAVLKDGIDANFVLDGAGARLTSPNGLSLQIETDQPCLQFYTGHKLTAPFAPFGGLCLEPQGYVDALNQGFPVALATPDEPYRQRSSFTVETT